MWERLRLLLAKLRVEGLGVRPLPKFKTTFYVVWVFALAGLGYGRYYADGSEATATSLLLSLSSWVAALLFVLLKNPWQRLRRFLEQIAVLLLAVAAAVALILGYRLPFAGSSLLPSIKIAWWSGSGLLTYFALRGLGRGFVFPALQNEAPYPGLRSAPILFILWTGNVLWWSWPKIIAFWG